MMCRAILSVITIVGSLLLFWVNPLFALEVIYPADKTYFSRSDFLIIKGGAPSLDAMTVEVNGAKSEPIDISGADYKAAFGDFLILQPDFDPGNNRVTIEGYVAGKKVAGATAEIYYLNGDPTAIPPSGFKPFVMHLPEREKLCAGCHNMNPDKAELLAESEESNPCASCHRRMLNHKYVHGPAGVYRCVYCHQADSKPARYQVRGRDAKLCDECHLEQMKSFASRKFVHGPVGAGLCSVCHDSHASGQPAQLLTAINDLCLGCHDKVGQETHVVRGLSGQPHPLKDVPDPSNPGRRLSCTSCHDPHGGASSALFQRGVTNRFALCQLCHQK